MPYLFSRIFERNFYCQKFLITGTGAIPNASRIPDLVECFKEFLNSVILFLNDRILRILKLEILEGGTCDFSHILMHFLHELKDMRYPLDKYSLNSA